MASVSPSLVKYGVAARLRPAVLHRSVHSVARDLASKLKRARTSDIVVPDGDEGAYVRLLERLSVASSLMSDALRDFEKELPERPKDRVHPAIRDLIVSSVQAASLLNRTLGRSRSSASVHVSAVAEEISSQKDVSFY